MINRLINEFRFFLERLLLRGAHFQILLMAILIVFISIAGGFLAYLFTPGVESLAKSSWWAFLRLSDPGYLGDDEGLLLRTVSTIITVLGYVVFMGALIAIMTQWLHRTMGKLESGLTSITQRDHILILGMTNRTLSIVEELLVSQGRVKRFLARIGARRLRIVILSEEVSAELAHDIKEKLGELWSHNQITLRSGTPLRIEHLERVDFLNAAVIILPGTDFTSEGSDVVDTKVVKTLLSISTYAAEQDKNRLPLVVTEVFDARKIPVARSAYKGEIEIVAGDTMISRLITQNVRHKGLSHIYSELLTHKEGNEIYIRECLEFEDQKFYDITSAFNNSILLGVLRQKDDRLIPIMNPPFDLIIEPGDKMVILGKNFADTEPMLEYNTPDIKPSLRNRIGNSEVKRRVLILGWNHKLPALIQEFGSYENESFEIDILSWVPISQREEYISRFDLNLHQVTLRHLQGDYTAPSDLKRIHPEEYDNIIFLGNDWLGSNEESDARAILGYLILRELIKLDTEKTELLVELMDPENEKLFQKRTGEVIISPLILSHILAHVALRRDLNLVFEELFTVGGAEIYLRSIENYGITRGEMSFRDLQNAVAEYGDIGLGVQAFSGEKDSTSWITINPPKESRWNLKPTDKLVVLTTYL